jgi:aminoglycoside phosphotransferase (APT) family kinase protein
MQTLTPDFDDARLGRYLEAHMNGFQGPLTSRKFAGGQSNPTFLLSAASGKYVLRRKPPGALLASAHAIDREYRVMKALQGSAVPVATPHVLCEDPDVIGSVFYVMSFAEGRIFWDPALPDVPRDSRQPIQMELVRVMAALHDIDIDAVGLSDFGKSGDYFARQFARWDKQYRASVTGDIPAMDELASLLASNLPKDDGQVSLVHGDFRIDNFIFHPTEPVALALIDWELSTLGHPMADLSYFCMGLRLPDLGSVIGMAGKDRTALGVPQESELVAQYCALRRIEPPSDWNIYLAFAFFRLAAIAQGVYKRALSGNASNKKALAIGATVTPLAEMGLKAAHETSPN